MNAVAMIDRPIDVPVALSIPDDLEFSAWVNLGRDLFARHRHPGRAVIWRPTFPPPQQERNDR